MTIELTPQNFRDAAALIEGKGWTRGVFARNKEGDRVDISSDKACCFCVVGAVAKASGAKNSQQAVEWEQSIDNCFSKHVLISSTTRWNDNGARNLEEVVKLLNEIADKLEKESK